MSIKGMLKLHIKSEIDLSPKNQKKVLDYITNLEKYKDEIFLYSYEELQDKVINLQQENKHLKDLYNQALKDYDELLETEGDIK